MNSALLILCLAASDTSVLSGVLRDESGKPVADQKVVIVFDWAMHGEGAQTATTNSDGRFSFQPTRGGLHLMIDRPGFERFQTQLTLPSAELTLTLRAAVPFSGHIAGAKVTGGWVVAFPPPPKNVELAKFLRSTRRIDSADFASDGSFSFKRLGRGDYLLDVHPSGAPSFTTLASAPNDKVTLTAPRGTPLRGVVHDAKGQPISNARVEAQTDGNAFTDTVEADANGVFEFGGVPDGELIIEATIPSPKGTFVIGGSRPCRMFTIRVNGGTPAPLDITLSGGGTIRGVVVDAQGKPIPNATVVASASGDAILCHSRATDADENGKFELKDIQDGEFELFASASDRQFSAHVKAKAGTENVKLIITAR